MINHRVNRAVGLGKADKITAHPIFDFNSSQTYEVYHD